MIHVKMQLLTGLGGEADEICQGTVEKGSSQLVPQALSLL